MLVICICKAIDNNTKVLLYIPICPAEFIYQVEILFNFSVNILYTTFYC